MNELTLRFKMICSKIVVVFDWLWSVAEDRSIGGQWSVNEEEEEDVVGDETSIDEIPQR